MKKLIIGVATVCAVGLTGCMTSKRAVGFSSETASPARVAQNPSFSPGSRGPLVQGTVVTDYKDSLVLRDEQGLERSLRVDEQTVYRNMDGDIVSREFLAPGAQVLTSFDYNNQERIAREVIIGEPSTRPEPNAWPAAPSPYH